MTNIEAFAQMRYNRDEVREFIVKYNGNIESVGLTLNAVVEILSSQYAIITMRVDDLPLLVGFKEVESIEMPKNLFTAISNGLNYACITPVKRPIPYGLTGRGVIVAIIDSGINYTHPEFVNTDGTSRIAWLWDQNIDGNHPKGFNIGSEYSNEDINRALASRNPFTIVPSRDNAGHGTPVAAIACGNTGAASESTIIAVKLGYTAFSDFTRTTEIMRAIKYVIDKAIDMNMPCSINLSYGSNEGSHTGQTLFESFINDSTTRWKTCITAASGNEGASGHHYYNVLKQGQTLDIYFTIASHAKTMYVSLWKNFVDDITFELITPSGYSTGVISSQNHFTQIIVNNVKVSVIYTMPSHFGISQEVYFYFESLGDTIPAGVVTLVARGRNITDGTINAWLPTDEEVTSNTAFLHPTTDLTMTLPSTAGNMISIGGYRANTDTISVFSGRGDPMCNSHVKLDMVAPAENIISASASGGYSSYTGTSMAAPFASGSAALLMQWGIINGNDPFLYGQKIKSFLCRNALRNKHLDYPNSIWGYGRLNLCNTVNNLQNYNGGGY